MSEAHDWTADPRPLADCLKDFNRRLNGGHEYGARKVGRAAIGIDSDGTYRNLLDGKPTPYEATIRLAMVEAERRQVRSELMSHSSKRRKTMMLTPTEIPLLHGAALMISAAETYIASAEVDLEMSGVSTGPLTDDERASLEDEDVPEQTRAKAALEYARGEIRYAQDNIDRVLTMSSGMPLDGMLGEAIRRAASAIATLRGHADRREGIPDSVRAYTGIRAVVEVALAYHERRAMSE